jgi:D-inositol-3-phosphate glycosyltransferase
MNQEGKHILLLGPAFPYRGGLAAFNERLALALQAAGHRVTLITFTLQYPRFLFPGKTQYTTGPAPEGLVIKRQLNAVNPLNWLRVGLALRRRRADVVIAAFWLPFMAPCLGTVLRLLSPRKTQRIGLVHNIIPHEKRFGDRLLARYFTGAADAFLTLSEAVQIQVASFTTAPVRTAPHPVYDSYGELLDQSAARTQLGLDRDGRYLLFFGFIRAYKGLDLALRAMVDKRLQDLNVKLIVAGEYYGNELEYQELIANLGIADRLELRTHFIPNEEVRYYFCAADLVVQPYRTATQSGISQLAYFFEKPMVVTRVGGLPEIVPDGVAGYVIEQDPVELAAAVADFYENNRAATLNAGVLRGKERFSWSGFVDTLTELFVR